MNPTSLVIAALLPTLFHPPHQSSVMTIYGAGDWRLAVTRDSFSDQVSCRIANRKAHQPPVTAVSGALEFHFGHGVDTSNAWFGINGGPPRPTQNLYAELVAAGAINQAEKLDNPTGGHVLIPLRQVLNASYIMIRAWPGQRPYRFDLGGLDGLIASANSLGCHLH